MTTQELDEKRAKSEEAAQEWSTKSGYPYFDSREIVDFESLASGLSLRELQEYGVAPLVYYSPTHVELGLTSSTRRERLPELQTKHAETKLTFKAISEVGLEHILNSIFLTSFKDELEGKFEEFGTRIANQPPKSAFGLIAQLAYLMRTSDVHIEPAADRARIRFRIDGVLHPITTVAMNAYKVFLSDLQTRAEIKWGSGEPQSGRISYLLISSNATSANVNMRIETIPVFHGEEIVVRLMNTEPQYLHLEKLGFSADQMKCLSHLVKQQSGMILTVGPTGSGKTSTLYAVINQLNTPETKIVTLEDPVEYDLAGISQVPIKTGDQESFTEKLRAVMREDPNVIMIGEIRDIDTAKTALQAALTGHLVLSTFHASSSATAISRLMDMIGNNPLLPSALHMVQAQRLVRRICPHCTEEYKPDPKTLDIITQMLQKLPQKHPPSIKELVLRRGKGCLRCHGIGYLGRVGIVEQMVISSSIEKLMAHPDTTTAQDLEAEAVKEGMVTLAQDAILKVLAGQTTIQEINAISDL